MNQGPADRPDRLQEALSQLPRGIEPGRDLWPGIAARLEPRSEPARVRAVPRWAWAAAAATVLVVASSIVTAPPCMRMTLATIDRPSPAPRSLRRPGARQNRSKIRGRIAAGTPGPESLTTTSAGRLASTRTVEPFGVWSAAFSTRLRSAW